MRLIPPVPLLTSRRILSLFMENGVSASEYHEQTKHTPQSIRRGPGLDFDNKPRPDKRYENVPRVSVDVDIGEPSLPTLRAVATSQEAHSNETASIDRATIADLCYYAAGITKTLRLGAGEHEFRAAACTGALYHIDLYAVCRDLSGLAAGVYHFDPQTNTLEVLREGDYRWVLANATENSSVELAPVTFVATSTWWRNAWKYRERTYRHAFWDSGTVLANLLATAAAHNRSSEVVVGFADDSVANLLGVDPEWEAPIAMATVGAGAPIPEMSETALEPINPPTEPLNSDPRAYPLISRAWSGSTLPEGNAAREWINSGERPVDGQAPGDGTRIELDSVGPQLASSRPLYTTIRRRGSCREYKRESLSFRKLSTVLDRATRGVPMDVRSEDGGTLQLVDCYCIVNGVDGVDGGAYQYHPDIGELELLHAGQYRNEAGQLALGQQLGADAAVCVYFMTDLEALTDALGSRGYRAAQLEAALTAGRLYLATYAHRDLGGTGLTFFDDLVTDFFAPRAQRQTPMFLYTLGRPAEDE